MKMRERERVSKREGHTIPVSFYGHYKCLNNWSKPTRIKPENDDRQPWQLQQLRCRKVFKTHNPINSFFLFSLSQDASNQSTLGATIKILFVCVDVVVVVVVVFDIIVVVVVIDAVVVVGVVAVVVDDANFFV